MHFLAQPFIHAFGLRSAIGGAFVYLQPMVLVLAFISRFIM
jgi:hypothetical protein